jgi:hypothetical protein
MREIVAAGETFSRIATRARYLPARARLRVSTHGQLASRVSPEDTDVFGKGNTASGESASVGGGLGNTAAGGYASVSGGQSNESSGRDSAVSGGYKNTAKENLSSIFGGKELTTKAVYEAIP